jgi:hypothetical protein
VTTVTLEGWSRAPKLGVLLPDPKHTGWIEGAFWCGMLDAWGFRAERISPHEVETADCTTLIVPVATVQGALLGRLRELDPSTIVLVGSTDPIPELAGAHRFPGSVAILDAHTTEGIVDRAHDALLDAATHGLFGMWRWPDGADAALVVDGDVDHPTGVDPQCARYVAPAIATMRRAGFSSYGIFVAAANVDAEPASFPHDVDYYNHSFSHPYSHWNAAHWESLDEDAMTEEIVRSNDAFRRHLGQDDHGVFRLPHFQLEASDRTYSVLDRLGYRAESSIGGNVAITGGLPFHPAVSPWSARPQDAAYARTHPDPSRRHRILQLPISTDPTDRDFPNGCCSYNTLGEGVRDRTADPDAYEEVLEAVVTTALRRNGLAHLFIDPPDAGYGRLPEDTVDYASTVERWLVRATARHDLSALTTGELAGWWLAREDALTTMTSTLEHDRLVVDIPDAPPGASLFVREPSGTRTRVTLTPAVVP